MRDLVDGIAERAPVMANRVVSLLSKVFTFGLDREIVTTSPAVRITRPTKESERERVLTDDELRSFWTITGTFEAAMRAFWRLRLLTAQRAIEVSTMRWSDVDLDAAVWTIPATVGEQQVHASCRCRRR